MNAVLLITFCAAWSAADVASWPRLHVGQDLQVDAARVERRYCDQRHQSEHDQREEQCDAALALRRGRIAVAHFHQGISRRSDTLTRRIGVE
jgi:hypothetical protein